MKILYTSKAIRRRFPRLSLRELQWWDERGIIKAARQDGKRVYSAEQVAALMVTKDLRSRGVSLFSVRKMLRAMLPHLEKRPAYMLLASRNGGPMRCLIFKNADRAIHALAKIHAGAMLVELEPIYKRLK